MKRFLRGVRRGEKGFTMIELLIVIAILGILAAVVVPNLAGFIGSGHSAAANQEVATVETAAMAFYATTQDWPLTSADLLPDYINATPAYAVYAFDEWGKVDLVDDTVSLIGTLYWTVADHQWHPGTPTP
jgi:type IV pilus assembly protein PilA